MHPTSQTPWRSVLLLILSSFSSMLFLSSGALMCVAGLLEFSSGEVESARSTLMISAGSLFTGVLLWPAVYYSLMKVLNKTAKELPFHRIPTSVLAMVWFLSAGLGMLGVKNASISMLLIPLNLLTFVLPVWILVRIGLQGLDAGSAERRWGTVAVGMTIVPLLIGILEIMVVVFIAALVILWISFNPSLMNQIESLGNRLIYINNPDAILKILSPYIFQPVVIFALLAFLSVCIPLVEELIKPLAVWLNPKSLVSPGQGFAVGVLGGASYALVESLGVSPGISGSMNILSVARVGTDLLHITTAGLMGWALVRCWQERKLLQLGATYLIVILLHGLWNALSLASALGSAVSYMPNPSPLLRNLSMVSTIGLVFLTFVNLAILVRANKWVRLPVKPTSYESSGS